MGNPTTARRINEVTVIDKNGNVILEYGSTYATGVTRKNYWDNWQTKLVGDSVLNIGSKAQYQDALNFASDGTFNPAELNFIESKLQRKSTWTQQETQLYVNDLFNRLINNPDLQALDPNWNTNKEQWEVAILNGIMENLFVPLESDYLTERDRFNESPGENYLDQLLLNEFRFLTNQGKQDAKYLLRKYRVAATIEEMNKEGWIDDETFARSLGFDKLIAKYDKLGPEGLTQEERETVIFVSQLIETDGERMELMSDETSSTSFPKLTNTLLKSVSEDDRLNNKNDARYFPTPLSERQKQNAEARNERLFNLWNESAGLEKAIRSIDPNRFIDESDNNTKQAILNNAFAAVQNDLVSFRVDYIAENPGASEDEIEQATFNQYRRWIEEPIVSVYDLTSGGTPQKSTVNTYIDKAALNYAKNNPSSYVKLSLTEAGLLEKDISQPIKDYWNKEIPKLTSIEQVNALIGDSTTLQNYALAAKNQALAEDKETLKAMAQSFLGITSATSEDVLDLLSQKNKAVDQIADMFSAYYSNNPYTTETGKEIFNEFKKVYGLTPSGTFVKKRPIEEGFYSRVPGSYVQQGDQILASADDPNMMPPGYYDSAVMKAREALEKATPDEMEQVSQQLDESRPPQFAVESAFGVPAFRRVAPTMPITDEEVFKNLQASYADRPEFLKFLIPNIDYLKKEFYKTQTPTPEQEASAVDMFSKQQMAKEFEKTKPASIGKFLNAGLPGNLEQQFKFTNLFTQQEERLADEEQAKRDQEERERRRQLISQPVTIFGRRRR